MLYVHILFFLLAPTALCTSVWCLFFYFHQQLRAAAVIGQVIIDGRYIYDVYYIYKHTSSARTTGFTAISPVQSGNKNKKEEEEKNQLMM